MTSQCIPFLPIRQNTRLSREHDDEIDFFVDSGASKHLVKEEPNMTDAVNLIKPTPIGCAKEGEMLSATKKGNLEIAVKENCNDVPFNLQDVLYVPDLKENLLSVNQFDEAGCRIIFENREVKIFHNDILIARAPAVGNLYKVRYRLRNEIGTNVANNVENANVANDVESAKV